MNHIIQYFYKENKNEQSQYGVKEQDYNKKNEYYFRCIVNFFYSSLYFNPDCKHYFIINDISDLDFIKGFNFKKFCDENNIKIIVKKSKYVGRAKKWAGSLYFFDAIETFIDDGRKNGEDNYFFFDNDILFNKSLSKCVDDLKEFQYMVYNINHEFSTDPDNPSDFNGVSVKELPKDLDFFGGEFFGIKGREIENFINIFKEIRLKHNFSTEEHYISYMLSVNLRDKVIIKEINNYLKRCWTTIKYRNTTDEDYNFAMLHLPSEKEYGLYWYNKLLIKKKFYDPEKALRYCSILKRTLLMEIKYVIKKVRAKVA